MNVSGLFLLLLGKGVAVNPGLAMNVINVRSIRKKDVVISDNIKSHNIDSLYLLPPDTESLLKFKFIVFIQRSVQ